VIHANILHQTWSNPVGVVIVLAVGLVVGAGLTWLAVRARFARQGRSRDDQVAADASEAAGRLAELATLTGGLAHEIRNPLSTLKVNLQLLTEDWREATEAVESDLCRRSLAKIETLRTEADRLQDILDDFLQYIGRQELHRTPTNLNELVDDVLVFFRPQALAQNVQVRATLWPEPLICQIDPDKLKQALLNLFLNAQQAMDNGGELMVRTSAETEPDACGQTPHARIEVIDTGHGIGTEDLDKIFHPYYSTKREGTGLGLPATRRIVQGHCGTLHVHSEPGQGSHFTVRLPLAEMTGNPSSPPG